MEVLNIIITPFGDNQAHGDLAGAVIFERRRGQVMVRKFAVPKNPRSPDQTSQRIRFADAVLAWQALPEPGKASWRRGAIGMVMTGYNLFIRSFLNGYFPSRTPMIIMDIRNITIVNSRASSITGWQFRFDSSPVLRTFGRIFDRERIYYDLQTYPPGIGLSIRLNSVSDPFAIQAGDILTMDYDSTGTMNIYLPAVSGTSSFSLWVADDGSTYYDSTFLNLAQGAPPPP